MAKASRYEILVSRIMYTYAAEGYATNEGDGLVKVIANRENGRELGCHTTCLEALDPCATVYPS